MNLSSKDSARFVSIDLVASAIDVSKRTWNTIRQNLFWAFAFNVIGIPLAALGYLTPAIAGSAMD